jgi:hypothetical protein
MCNKLGEKSEYVSNPFSNDEFLLSERDIITIKSGGAIFLPGVTVRMKFGEGPNEKECKFETCGLKSIIAEKNKEIEALKQELWKIKEKAKDEKLKGYLEVDFDKIKKIFEDNLQEAFGEKTNKCCCSLTEDDIKVIKMSTKYSKMYGIITR